MHDSLAKLVEGETISDYECSGCKKKVDIHKRTLLAEAPNILVVHLQRILFDFNTFQNEKMNQLFEFPNDLDLSPYSYHAVMTKEGLLKKGEEAKGGEDEGQMQTQADDQKKDGDDSDEEQVEPIVDDCWEYTLAGDRKSVV